MSFISRNGFKCAFFTCDIVPYNYVLDGAWMHFATWKYGDNWYAIYENYDLQIVAVNVPWNYVFRPTFDNMNPIL